VYICENNQYTEWTPTRALTAGEIAARARPFGISASVVDGQDVLAVYATASEAVARARGGGGPSLIEAHTYRYRGHSEREEAFLGVSYRTEEEEAEWRARDPIPRLATRLREMGVLNEQEVEQRVNEAVDGAVAFADRSAYPPPEMALEDHFATPVGRAS
jgi:pyruvate dehydrogenase E1 component alpha subunit